MVTKQQGQIIAVVLTAIVATAAITYALTRTIHTSGIIKSVGIEVYTSPEFNEELTSIDWGMLAAGDVAYTDCWIRNTKNTNISLSFQTTNWQPDKAQLYLTLSSDVPADRIIVAKDFIQARLTLTVSDQIQDVEAFSFDVIISATEKMQSA